LWIRVPAARADDAVAVARRFTTDVSFRRTGTTAVLSLHRIPRSTGSSTFQRHGRLRGGYIPGSRADALAVLLLHGQGATAPFDRGRCFGPPVAHRPFFATGAVHR
jgi:hypothetical protein